MKQKLISAVMAMLMAIAVIPLVGCFGGAQARPTLRVFNYGMFIDPAVLREFEEEYGVRIIYNEFNSNEEMYIVVSRNPRAHDVIVASDYMIDRMIQEELLARLDHSLIPNIRNIAPQYLGAAYDPNNEFSIPYKVGTLGIIYNTTMVYEPVTSWSALWDERYAGEIFIWDSVRDGVGMALAYLGFSMNSTDEEELMAAQEALLRQRPLVQAYLGDEIMDKMIGGEGILALEYSGGAAFSMSENPDLNFVVPYEGSNKWKNSWAVLRETEELELAHKFINFINRPDVARRNMAFTFYTTPVYAAWEYFDDCPVKFPSDEVLARSEEFVFDREGARRKAEIWTIVTATR